jgi:hypothetical protein
MFITHTTEHRFGVLNQDDWMMHHSWVDTTGILDLSTLHCPMQTQEHPLSATARALQYQAANEHGSGDNVHIYEAALTTCTLSRAAALFRSLLARQLGIIVDG